MAPLLAAATPSFPTGTPPPSADANELVPGLPVPPLQNLPPSLRLVEVLAQLLRKLASRAAEDTIRHRELWVLRC